MFDPEVEARPWENQLALDNASFREQVEYLRARSSFYRDRLAGFEGVRLAEIAELPLTEKDELRATRTADNPILIRRPFLRRWASRLRRRRRRYRVGPTPRSGG